MTAKVPIRKQAEIYRQEAQFHDDWSQAVRVEDIPVHAAFEAPTAPENAFIFDHMGCLEGKRLLDIGSGLGESSVYFALHGAEVTATDISPGMIQFALRLGEHFGVKIKGVVSCAETLAVASNSFDFVYMANLLHHITDREALLRDVCRVLKPGGRLYCWDPLAYNPVIKIYRRMATGVRTADERPLTLKDVGLLRAHLANFGHRSFWLTSLALFLKYYLVDRVSPNEERYWKKILKEPRSGLWWWYPLRAIDKFLLKMPCIRWLAWNVVMWGEKSC